MNERDLLLIKLTEECAQVIRAITDSLQAGPQATQPIEQFNNGDRIQRAVHGAMAVLEVVQNLGYLEVLHEGVYKAHRNIKKAEILAFLKTSGSIREVHAIVQKCPVCLGVGTVPYNFYSSSSDSSSVSREQCRSCEGRGTVLVSTWR